MFGKTFIYLSSWAYAREQIMKYAQDILKSKQPVILHNSGALISLGPNNDKTFRFKQLQTASPINTKENNI